ncbi:MAG TPA: glucosamine-6-phosphate isomerase [Gemmataceae bacterium]|jgi:glucosamine-6-phosphate deaminase
MSRIPDYLAIPPEALGRGQPVRVCVVGDAAAVAHGMADAMLAAFRAKPDATVIVPVGPVDQFPILAEMVNAERLSLRAAVVVNMDEYLTDEGAWLPTGHPLSFRGFMARQFYDRLDPALAPPPEHRVFPDPHDPAAVGRLIARRGGADACFGGVGINGHVAFNEPPEPGAALTVEQFAALPARVLDLARETRTINAVTVGGDIAAIPRRCVTVGMREILAARALRFYCNRPWHAGVVRRLLHGPVTPACPASLLRTHADAELAVADYVAAAPVVGLR